MNNLLKFEFRKLFRSKAFFICLALSAVGVFIVSLTNFFLLKAFSDDVSGEMTALNLLKDLSSNYVLLSAIFISIFVTEDYSSETIKNVYSKGFARPAVFWSKYVASLAGCMAFVLVTAVLQVFLGAVVFDGIGKAGHNYALSLITTLLLLATYHAIFFALAIALRKTGAAIALAILGPSGVDLALTLVDTIIKGKLKFTLSNYWLPGRLSALMDYDVAGKEIVAGVIVAVLFTAAALIASFVANQERDC